MKEGQSTKILTPTKLLNLLLSEDYKQFECVNANQVLSHQKSILTKQIGELRDIVQRKRDAILELESFFLLRAQLRLKLEQVRNQRRVFENEIVNNIQKIKNTAIQVRHNARTIAELDQIRKQNSKLSIKLNQMIDYGDKLEERVVLQQKQKRIISRSDQNERTTRMLPSIDNYEQLNWRQKISLMKEEEKNLSLEFREKVEAKDKQNKWKMKMQNEKLRTYVTKTNLPSFKSF